MLSKYVNRALKTDLWYRCDLDDIIATMLPPSSEAGAELGNILHCEVAVPLTTRMVSVL